MSTETATAKAIDHQPMLMAGSAVFVLLCWLMPMLYVLVLWQAKLKALPTVLPLHLSSVPWTDPTVAVLTGISVFTLFGVFIIGRTGLRYVRRRAMKGKPDSRLLILVGAILGGSLLETVAIYGLVLSFATQGSVVLPLTMMLMAAAPLGHLLLWPRPSSWRSALGESLES